LAQCVARALVVPRVVDVQTTIEAIRLEDHLELRGPFRLQERVARGVRAHAGAVRSGLLAHLRRVLRTGREGLERVRGTRLHAVRAVRAAKADTGEPARLRRRG